MTANGFQVNRDPVLEPLETIRLQDALLDRSDPKHPEEADWPKADFIVGNPPYLGGKLLRRGLGDQYVEDLFSVYKGRVAREGDLVTYFFEKAREMIANGRTKRAGLLATNSIRGGANRKVLRRIKESGDIFMAWSDEPWILNGAAVRISIVGFDNGFEKERTLNGESVAVVNPDLTSTLDVTNARILSENLEIAFMGDSKGGPFEITEEHAKRWLALPLNPNGRPNSDVVRPWVNGLDITRRPRGMWIVDFGLEMPEETASLYEAPFEHVKSEVLPKRVESRTTTDQWWLHERPRREMRAAIEGLDRILCTARVATHRLFVWLDAATLADSQIIVFARQDDYFFGVLHSRAHEVWSLRMGTSLEDRPRYTPTTCFETFPLPWPPGQEPWRDPRLHAIAEAAHELNDLREKWLNPPDASEAELKKRTLTNLYNARPAWLAAAHDALDCAVWTAYGWNDSDPDMTSGDEILVLLLTLNRARSEQPGG
jgi:type II restriction/modification system DNA methylase subunit YeeA